MATTQLRERASAGPLDRVAMRTVDVLASGFALLVLSPLLLAIAVIVRTTSKGPALLRQRRVGVDGRTFTVLKFRTMYVGLPVYFTCRPRFCRSMLPIASAKI